MKTMFGQICNNTNYKSFEVARHMHVCKERVTSMDEENKELRGICMCMESDFVGWAKQRAWRNMHVYGEWFCWVRKAKNLEKHACVWRVILLGEESKELGETCMCMESDFVGWGKQRAWVDKYHESFMAKLNRYK